MHVDATFAVDACELQEAELGWYTVAAIDLGHTAFVRRETTPDQEQMALLLTRYPNPYKCTTHPKLQALSLKPWTLKVCNSSCLGFMPVG